MKTKVIENQKDICQFEIRDSFSRIDLKELISNIEIISPYKDINEFLKKIDSLSEFLPVKIKSMLKDFRRNGNKQGFILLKGLSVDIPLPKTPIKDYTTGIEKLKETFVSELWLCLIASFLGDPFGYRSEDSDAIFSNILPGHIPGEEQLSTDGKFVLNFRTEVAFHSKKPDYVLLFCLRPGQEKRTVTYITCIREICKALGDKEKELLRKPIYKTDIYSNNEPPFAAKSSTKGLSISREMSILYGDLSDPFLRIDPHMMLTNNTQARCALDKIKGLFNFYATEICMEAGDILIIDNNRACHARGPYRATLDGSDRWLQKLFVSKNLDQFLASTDKNERVLSQLF